MKQFVIFKFQIYQEFQMFAKYSHFTQWGMISVDLSNIVACSMSTRVYMHIHWFINDILFIQCLDIFYRTFYLLAC